MNIRKHRGMLTVTAIVVMLSMLFVSCSEPQNEIPGSATLTVRVADMTKAKTITPSGNVDVSHYKITVDNVAEDVHVTSDYLDKGETFTVTNVPAGLWTATVDAYVLNEGNYVKVATAISAETRVTAGESATLTVTLDTLADSLSGAVTVTLKMPSELDDENDVFWYIYSIQGSGQRSGVSIEHTTREQGTTGADGLATISITDSLNQGSYLLTVTVYDSADEGTTNVSRTGVDIMRLLPGLEATGQINLDSQLINEEGFKVQITDKVGDILTPETVDDTDIYEIDATDSETEFTVTLAEAVPEGFVMEWYVDGILAEETTADNTSYVLVLEKGKHSVVGIMRDDAMLMSVGSVSFNVNVRAEINIEKPLEFGTGRIAGVAWDYGDPDPQLYRLYTSSEAADFIKNQNASMKTMDDPYDLVTRDILEEPVSSYEGNPGSSPFDEFGPWQDMKLVAMADGGAIMDTIGDGETIRAFVDEHDNDNMDFMVYLPDAYVRVIDDPENQMRYYYVSDKPFDGAQLQPASGHYIGRYDAMDPDISGTQSSSNKADEVYSRPSYNATGTKEVARYLNHQNAYDVTRKRNEGITPVDGKMYGGLLWEEVSYVQMIYLVEYANLNSQSTLGYGSGDRTSGDSDDMPYHTGVIGSKTEEDSDVQYRYIEGLFGADYNSGDTVENLLVLDRVVYIAPDEASLTRAGEGTVFSQDDDGNDVPSDWIAIGTLPDDDYISAFGYDEERQWSIGLPSEASGSSSTYVCDYVDSPYVYDLGSVRLTCNGLEYDGAWGFNATHSPSLVTAEYAARLSFR